MNLKLEFYKIMVSHMVILISKLLHFPYYLNNLLCREETLYFGDNTITPYMYLYKGQHTLNFEQRI